MKRTPLSHTMRNKPFITFNFSFLIWFSLLFSLTQCSETKQIHIHTIDVSQDLVVPEHYIIRPKQSELIIDGLANEQSWETAPFSENFIDIEGVKRPYFDTRFKMLWDSNYLYVFAELEEEHIWGNLHQRDTVIFYNNDFELFINPSGDSYTYGELEINALGTVWDLLLNKPYRASGKANNNWNIHGLKSAVHIHGTLNNPSDIDSLWSVEMAIPLKELVALTADKKLPEHNEQWRMNFSRVQWQYELLGNTYSRKKLNDKFLPESNWVWSNQKVINMHEPEKWGYVQFSSSAEFVEEEFISDRDLLYKQIAFALYRNTQKKRYVDLLNSEQNTTELWAKYSDRDSLRIKYSRTEKGYEFILPSSYVDRSFAINQDGYLKSVP